MSAEAEHLLVNLNLKSVTSGQNRIFCGMAAFVYGLFLLLPEKMWVAALASDSQFDTLSRLEKCSSGCEKTCINLRI